MKGRIGLRLTGLLPLCFLFASRAHEGTLLPTDGQTHLTLEPTAGLAPEFAIGFMFLNARGRQVIHPSSPGGGFSRISICPSR